MGDTRPFTLRDIEEKTSVPLRTLQFWTNSAVLQPEGDTEHPGRGTARLFSGNEVMIAAVLWPLAIAGGMTLGRLKSVASLLRMALTSRARRQPLAGGAIFDIVTTRAAIKRATEGLGVNLLVISFATDGRGAIEAFTDANGPVQLDLDSVYPEGYPRGAATTFIIHLTETLAPLFTG
jgi:hypothetical protein